MFFFVFRRYYISNCRNNKYALYGDIVSITIPTEDTPDATQCRNISPRGHNAQHDRRKVPALILWHPDRQHVRFGSPQADPQATPKMLTQQPELEDNDLVIRTAYPGAAEG